MRGVNKVLALLLLLGAIGGFGLWARRDYQVQDHTRSGTPVGQVRTVIVNKSDRIFFMVFGLACAIGSAYLIARSR